MRSVVEPTGSRLRLCAVAERISRRFGRPCVLESDPETPVFLPSGSSAFDPWDLEVALLRSGLRLHARLDGLSVDGSATDLARDRNRR